MPKAKVAPRPTEHVPMWDALIAELGDPRPYESVVTQFTTVTVTDEPCLDLDEFDDATYALDRAVEDADVAVMDLQSEGHATLDHIVDEFRERHQIPEPSPDPVLVELQERTVVLPALVGERTVRLERSEVPPWPY